MGIFTSVHINIREHQHFKYVKFSSCFFTTYLNCFISHFQISSCYFLFIVLHCAFMFIFLQPTIISFLLLCPITICFFFFFLLNIVISYFPWYRIASYDDLHLLYVYDGKIHNRTHRSFDSHTASKNTKWNNTPKYVYQMMMIHIVFWNKYSRKCSCSYIVVIY